MRAALFLILIVIASELRAQWQSLGNPNVDIHSVYHDTLAGAIYFGGNFSEIGGIESNTIVKYDIGTNQFESIGILDPCDQFCPPTYAITKYKGEIYAGVNREWGFVQDFRGIARFNDTIWKPLGGGLRGSTFAHEAIIRSLVVFRDTLFVGGSFYMADSMWVNSMAKWDGENWHSANFPFPGHIHAFTVFDGALWAGGHFIKDQKTSLGIARYENGKWFQMHDSLGFGGLNVVVRSLKAYEGELYAAGYLLDIDGKPMKHIAKLEGDEWVSVGGGIGQEEFDGSIYGLSVFDGRLFAYGHFDRAGGVPVTNIAYWNNDKWCDIGYTFSGLIFMMEPLEDKVYLGGGFLTMDGFNTGRLIEFDDPSFDPDSCGTYFIGQEEIVNNESEINFFPNPTSGFVTIQIPKADELKKIQITDALGKIWIQEFLNSNEPRISLKELPHGLYFIRVSTGERSYVQRVIKL